jgi:Peptidase inhibitor I78 family
MKPLFFAIAALALSIGTTAVVAQNLTQNLAECGRDEFQFLVGKPEGLVHAQLPTGARVIPPNSPVTQDYRPERANFDLDKDGVIVRIWCG